MIFTETPLKGAFLVELEPLEDSRGFFARTWCNREAAALGLNARIAQCNVAFMQHWTTSLSATSHRAIYVPEGFAHGLQTLQDDTEVFYQMSAPYAPEANTGVRWNDPVFGFRWPLAVAEVSERDRTFPDFRPPGPFGPR